jgi:hypothetical protein
MRAGRLKDVAAVEGAASAVSRALGYGMRRAARTIDRLSTPASGLGLKLLPAAPARAALRANAGWRDIWPGRKALVVATGPSAMRVDPSWAEGRVVVSVNENHRLLNRLSVTPDVLVVADTVYWTDGRYADFLPELDEVATQTGARVVLPISALGTVKRRGLFRKAELGYTVEFGRLSDHFGRADPPRLDLTAPVPGLHSVGHMAVAVALHAGCRDVGLIGIDLDYIATPRRGIAHAYGASDFNDHEDQPVLATYAAEKGFGYPDLLELIAQQQRAYAVLDAVARRHGGRVVNFNPEGLLETLERAPPPAGQRHPGIAADPLAAAKPVQ